MSTVGANGRMCAEEESVCAEEESVCAEEESVCGGDEWVEKSGLRGGCERVKWGG